MPIRYGLFENGSPPEKLLVPVRPRSVNAAHKALTAGSGLGAPVRRPGLQPTLSVVAHSLRSNGASDGRQDPEPQASEPIVSNFFGGEPIMKQTPVWDSLDPFTLPYGLFK